MMLRSTVASLVQIFASHFISIGVPDSNSHLIVEVVPLSCSSIAGDFEFLGVSEIANESRRVSFLQHTSRPSRQGVVWMRITETSLEGYFKVSFFDRAGRTVGEDVAIMATCVAGQWIERSSFKGNSDGTLVSGKRTWTYSFVNTTSLLVKFEISMVSQYFPGLRSSEKTVASTVAFESRHPRDSRN